MKKHIFSFFLWVLAIGLLSSCIKEEAPNMEADIEEATFENAADRLRSQPIISNDRVTFRLRKFSGDYLFAPEFTLTPGATIVPESGTELDFFEAQEYTVTSEDGV